MIEKEVNRKSQGVPQSQTAANPRHQNEEKKGQTKTKTNTCKTNKQTNARGAHRPAPSSPSEVLTMLKEMKKHDDKEQGKTMKT